MAQTSTPPRHMTRLRAFAVLGLEPGASPSEVKAAWRAGVRRWHPDVGGDAVRFREVHAAYRFLVDEPEPSGRSGPADDPRSGPGMSWQDVVDATEQRQRSGWRRAADRVLQARERRPRRPVGVLCADAGRGFAELWRSSRRAALRMLVVLTVALALFSVTVAQVVSDGRGVGVLLAAGAIMLATVLLLVFEADGRLSAFGPGWERVVELLLPLVAAVVLAPALFATVLQVIGATVLVVGLVRALVD